MGLCEEWNTFALKELANRTTRASESSKYHDIVLNLLRNKSVEIEIGEFLNMCSRFLGQEQTHPVVVEKVLVCLREAQIIGLYQAGKTSKEMAEATKIGLRTVPRLLESERIVGNHHLGGRKVVL